MIEQTKSRARAAAETMQGAREASASIAESDVRELERVLLALAEPGRELVSSPGQARAIVTDPAAAAPAAVTSTRIVDALLAIGWTRRIPASPGSKLRRDVISAAGLEARADIAAGHRRLAEASEAAPLAGPVGSRAQLRAEIMALPAAERLDYALDLLDELLGPEPGCAAEWADLGVRLTPAETRLAGRLAADRERLVGRRVLQRVIADPATPEDLPGAEALRAAVSRLRRKFLGAGLPIEIGGQPGAGYAMRAPASFDIPGQGEGAT
ncbi:hypothetical protein [Roseovarius sp. C03]|uniref:helix-turn-helix domain-containing protein n=1 Tax=Roseovarius sp. C03 TaxID=3449222 RepID=UPI003EDC5CCA